MPSPLLASWRRIVDGIVALTVLDMTEFAAIRQLARNIEAEPIHPLCDSQLEIRLGLFSSIGSSRWERTSVMSTPRP